jgi:hypothetical protein
MISEYGRRWRALRAWCDAFPPDDQERLLAQLERLLALARDRDMGAFVTGSTAFVSALSAMSGATRRPSSGEGVGVKTSSRDP